MSSRDKILNAVYAASPALVPLPDISAFGRSADNAAEIFTTTLTNIGGKVNKVTGPEEVKDFVKQLAAENPRVVTTLPVLGDVAEIIDTAADPHLLSDVDYAVVEAILGVAENGAVWITETQAGQRVLPFIAQHLVVLLNAQTIVPAMHEAYQQIGGGSYGYGAFIAGPSKTADIEQSLVLGAHGPRSMTVLLY